MSMNKDYYSLDIKFKTNKVDSRVTDFFQNGNIHHCHLHTHKNEIELRVFFDDSTLFDISLAHCFQFLDWSKFGLYVDVSNVGGKERLQNIDLSEAKLMGIYTSTANYEGSNRYVVLKLDSVKFYWDPVAEKLNTAEFYLADAGFGVVETFYTHLHAFDGEIDIDRMDGMDIFYPLAKSEFRPEFNLYAKDKREDRIAKVFKEPRIKFKYNLPVTEEEALHYGEIVSSISSFFHHSKIEYILTRIHLEEHTITITSIRKLE